MYNQFCCTSPEAIQKQMEFYDIMLENLDRDNHFLKNSPLSFHVAFD